MTDHCPDVIDLTGLTAASPIGFMAALGLLRVCAQDHRRDVRLSWSPVGAPHARLHGLEREALHALLTEHMRGRSRAPEFNFTVHDDKGLPGPVMHLRTIRPADYRAAVAACRGDARALGFLAGFGTDAVVNDKGFIARNRFDFSSGQQKLVDGFRSLAADLDPAVRRPRRPLATRIECSLYGGPYEKRNSLGWDPATLMTHAHQPAAPTDLPTPGQPMTLWLAIESLPLHPVIPTARGHRTTGFADGMTYVWPQWREPLTLAEVTLLRQRPPRTLPHLPGLDALWTSRVTSVGEYGFLQPAARTRSVGALPEGFAQEESAE